MVSMSGQSSTPAMRSENHVNVCQREFLCFITFQATAAVEMSFADNLHRDQHSATDAASPQACPRKPPPLATRNISSSEAVHPSSEISAFHGLDAPAEPETELEPGARVSGQGAGTSQAQACNRHHEAPQHESKKEHAEVAAEDVKDASWCWEVRSYTRTRNQYPMPECCMMFLSSVREIHELPVIKVRSSCKKKKSNKVLEHEPGICAALPGIAG